MEITILKKYIKYLKPYIKYQIMIFILVILSSIIALINPILLKLIIDRVLILKELFLLKHIIIALVIFYLINSMISFSNGFLSNYMGQMISINIRKEAVSHIQKLKLSEVIESSIGDFISKLSEDVSTISGFFTGTFISLFSDSINLLASLALMLFYSRKLSIIAFVVTIIQLAISMKFSVITRENQKEIREVSSSHISILKWILSGIKHIKAYQIENANEKTYSDLLNHMKTLSFKKFYIYFNYGTCLSFISLVGSILLFSFGVLEITNGNMTIGTLFVFDTVSQRFYAFAGKLVNLNVSIQGVMVAFDRLESIFSLKTEPSINTQHELSDSSINFDNVHFKYYKDEEKNVIDGISFELNSGEVYGLVGGSGEGKSTIIDLIMRFYDIDNGSIEFGKADSKAINIKDIRGKISLVLQNGIFSSGTIEENIRFGQTAVLEEIQRAAKICCIDDFINSLPNGYQTKVGGEGDTLSAGQKQRLSIARALIRQSDIYIFDEAFSNLDKKLEQRIFENLQKELNGKTQIYITHNVELIKNFKNIITIKDGKIDAIGDHDTLLIKSEVYKEFFLKGSPHDED